MIIAQIYENFKYNYLFKAEPSTAKVQDWYINAYL